MWLFGRLGRGQGSLISRRALAEALSSWPPVVIDPSRKYGVFDELAGCERLNLPGSVRLLDPFATTPDPGTVWVPVADGSAGEW